MNRNRFYAICIAGNFIFLLLTYWVWNELTVQIPLDKEPIESNTILFGIVLFGIFAGMVVLNTKTVIDLFRHKDLNKRLVLALRIINSVFIAIFILLVFYWILLGAGQSRI